MRPLQLPPPPSLPQRPHIFARVFASLSSHLDAHEGHGVADHIRLVVLQRRGHRAVLLLNGDCISLSRVKVKCVVSSRVASTREGLRTHSRLGRRFAAGGLPERYG